MKEEAIAILQRYGQNHLLNFLPLLNEEEIHNLEEQILHIDFEQLQKLYEKSKQSDMLEEKKDRTYSIY